MLVESLFSSILQEIRHLIGLDYPRKLNIRFFSASFCMRGLELQLNWEVALFFCITSITKPEKRLQLTSKQILPPKWVRVESPNQNKILSQEKPNKNRLRKIPQLLIQ